MTPTIAILIAIAGLGFSAIFSGLETGLYTINRVRLVVRSEHGDQSAIRVRRILANPAGMLSTLLIGNNIANYAGSFGLAALLDRTDLGEWGLILVNAAVLIPLLFVFAETLPKDLFRTHTDRWSYGLSGFLVAMGFVFTVTGLTPLVQGVGRLVARLLGSSDTLASTARQRVSRLIKEGLGAGVLTESQASLVDRALALRDLTVDADMVPFPRVDTVPITAGPEVIRRIAAERNRTRMPVIDRAGNVVGIVGVLDALVAPERPIAELMRPPLRIETGTMVQPALARMRRHRQKIAIVMRAGSERPAGIVTLKDLVEPLTGELQAW